MISAAQIREVASSYLSHDDGERFLLEFSPLVHNIHKNGEAEAIELADKIQSKMADLHSNLIAKSEFRSFLRQLTVHSFFNVYRVSPLVYTSSASAVQITAGHQWASPEASAILFADRQYA
jgi:hypothetical protein